MKRILGVVLVGFALSQSAGALAQERRAPMDPLFGGIVQDRDVTVFFDYLREALNAAVEGREAVPPEELTRRAEEMGEEMKRRGAVAARVLIDAIEASVRERLPR